MTWWCDEPCPDSPPPDWYALEARLLAFGSLPVVMAVQESSTVHFRALGAFRACAAAADETRADNDAPGMGAPIPAAQGEADRNVALDAAQIAARKGRTPPMMPSSRSSAPNCRTAPVRR
jgi:hypothetical protein